MVACYRRLVRYLSSSTSKLIINCYLKIIILPPIRSVYRLRNLIFRKAAKLEIASQIVIHKLLSVLLPLISDCGLFGHIALATEPNAKRAHTLFLWAQAAHWSDWPLYRSQQKLKVGRLIWNELTRRQPSIVCQQQFRTRNSLGRIYRIDSMREVLEATTFFAGKVDKISNTPEFSLIETFNFERTPKNCNAVTAWNWIKQRIKSNEFLSVFQIVFWHFEFARLVCTLAFARQPFCACYPIKKLGNKQKKSVKKQTMNCLQALMCRPLGQRVFDKESLTKTPPTIWFLVGLIQLAI